MPTSLAGTTNRSARSARGVTLIELLVVVALVSLMVGISFPAISSGIDSLRLNQASNEIAGFFNSALSRAERRQQAIEVTISKTENAIWMRSPQAGLVRRFEMPEGVTVFEIFPKLQAESEQPRSFLVYPGGTVPEFGVEVENRRHSQRIVRVDPITGVPRIESVE